MTQELAHFVAGMSKASADGARMDLINPLNGRVYGTAAQGSARDVDSAVRAARSQLNGGPWREIDGLHRGRLLRRLADLVERDTHILADMDAAAIGRSPMEPRLIDVPNAVAGFHAAAGWSSQMEGRTIPTSGHLGTRTLSYTRREPVGVVGAILPWSAPLMTTASRLAALLAAGCTVVVKPAEETPQSALHLAGLCREAGFPDGVVNVVTGLGSITGRALCEHPDVSKISFTGSHETGKEIQQAAGASFKRVSLELGGNNAQIVFDDAPLELALRGCAMGLFINQGQVCAAGPRILVQRGVAQRLSNALAQAAQAIKVGDPRQRGVHMGPLATRSQFDRVNRYIQSGIDQGAELLAGGVSTASEGWFVQPTIFANADSRMLIAREEIFGPVGVLIPFDTAEQAIELANDSAYGLAATVWTNDLVLAHQVAARINVGAVGVNCWNPLDANLPWGGLKASGMGREGGLAGALAYTEEKVITVLLPE